MNPGTTRVGSIDKIWLLKQALFLQARSREGKRMKAWESISELCHVGHGHAKDICAELGLVAHLPLDEAEIKRSPRLNYSVAL